MSFRPVRLIVTLHINKKMDVGKAQILVMGTLFTNGRRVVSGALRMMGLQHETAYKVNISRPYFNTLVETVCNAARLCKVELSY